MNFETLKIEEFKEEKENKHINQDNESDNEEDDNKSESHYHDILAQSSNEYKYQRYLKRHLKKILIEKLYEENHSVWKDYIEDDVQFKKTRKIFNSSFYEEYNKGYCNYKNGNWGEAKKYFENSHVN